MTRNRSLKTPAGVTDRDAARYFTWSWYGTWVVIALTALTFASSYWWLAALLASAVAVSTTAYARGYYEAWAEVPGDEQPHT